MPWRASKQRIQGVDAGGILDTMYSTRDPPEGGIFLNHDPLTRSATSDMTHFFVLVVFSPILGAEQERGGGKERKDKAAA